MLRVNEKDVSFQAGMTLADLARGAYADADILLVNGYPATLQTVLFDGDQCWLWPRGKVPSAEEMRHILYARHSPGVQARLQECVVGIMGLGGLGSVVAIALARMGIGALLLADYDVVEPTNLNRQQYFVDQIGQKKTAALRDILQRVNPHVALNVIDQRLVEDDIPVLFKNVHALVECFDDPAMKAAGLRAALQHLPGVFYVCASGLAGYGENNAIRTRRLYPRVYLVGDEISAAAPGEGLMAARVGIAAHHQANQVVRLLLGAENEAE
ncbi:sulfur carrier protein ThiS adenylyltransferase ThiF [Thiovibrio frasassiensis]|uniref:Sulfur carrier protein ThiS adenylyltransferase ThiF n=1 Tax=Thiovibrio frasassiensis TaxID=2984131 RepID=A0A9X4MHJ5_9BACT|nr:sulfur carrier protein ThiS adenylyltransferase ThiF [Thiovibrio frasassiensis]MDG4475975.1 sulfur carrier protein ThiS adenylyltransferase ThiF [Thiovibrio frasassiensis]